MFGNDRLAESPTSIPHDDIEESDNFKFKFAVKNLQYIADTAWSPDDFNKVCANIHENVRQTDERFRKFTSADILACIKVEDTPGKYCGPRQNKRSRRVRFSTGVSISVDNLFESDTEDGPTPELTFSDIDCNLIEVPPIPKIGNGENEVPNAYWEDSLTPGYGRKDGQLETRYNNPFDPRLTFDGLGSLISKSPTKECDKEPEVSAKDNYFMAVEKPQEVIEEFYNSYTKFLDELCDCSDVPLTTGLKENDGKISQKQFPVSDDDNESCRKLFDTIQSDVTKAIWSRPMGNVASNHPQISTLGSVFANQPQQNNARRELLSAQYSRGIPITENGRPTSSRDKARSVQQNVDTRDNCYGNATLENAQNCWNQRPGQEENNSRSGNTQTAPHWSDFRLQDESQRLFQATGQNVDRTQMFEELKSERTPTNGSAAPSDFHRENGVRMTPQTGTVDEFPLYSLFNKGGLQPVFRPVSRVKEVKEEMTQQPLYSLNANCDQEQTQLLNFTQHDRSLKPNSAAPISTQNGGSRIQSEQSYGPPSDTPQVKRLYPQLENLDLSEPSIDQNQERGVGECLSRVDLNTFGRLVRETQLRPTSLPFVPASQKTLRATAEPWQNPREQCQREDAWSVHTSDDRPNTLKEQTNKVPEVANGSTSQSQQTAFWQQSQFQGRANAHGQPRFAGYVVSGAPPPVWSAGEQPTCGVGIVRPQPALSKEQTIRGMPPVPQRPVFHPPLGLINQPTFQTPANGIRLSQPLDQFSVRLPPQNLDLMRNVVNCFALGKSLLVNNGLAHPLFPPPPPQRLNTPVYQPIAGQILNAQRLHLLGQQFNPNNNNNNINNNNWSDEDTEGEEIERYRIPTITRTKYSNCRAESFREKQPTKPRIHRPNLVQIDMNDET
ncbi:hypothetical protein ScPMuIL_005773 [Solemya velum]